MRNKLSIKNIYYQQQEFLMNILVVLFCLLLSSVFPTANYFQKITSSFFFLIVLPIAYIRIILQKDLPSFGLTFSKKPQTLLWAVGIFFLDLFLFFLLFKFTNFAKNYQINPYVATDFRFFLAYEFLFVALLFFIYEFFFRGFLLSVLRGKLNEWSIAIQAVVYLFLIYLGGSLNISTAPIALLSVTGGLLAYRTKSFLYSYLVNLSAIIILDAYFIHLLLR